jgi:predicted transcriptional regulator
MATKTKTREVTITDEGGAFAAFFKRFTSETHDFDFESLATLRKLLSNERAKLLHILKTKKPSSLYQLAKLLGRDFKAVRDDVLLLERFGFLEIVAEKTGKRNRLRPVLVVDQVQIKIKL